MKSGNKHDQNATADNKKQNDVKSFTKMMQAMLRFSQKIKLKQTLIQMKLLHWLCNFKRQVMLLEITAAKKNTNSKQNHNTTEQQPH
jgi:hypothetical protein